MCAWRFCLRIVRCEVFSASDLCRLYEKHRARHKAAAGRAWRPSGGDARLHAKQNTTHPRRRVDTLPVEQAFLAFLACRTPLFRVAPSAEQTAQHETNDLCRPWDSKRLRAIQPACKRDLERKHASHYVVTCPSQILDLVAWSTGQNHFL